MEANETAGEFTVTAVIADDEPLARAHLRRLLEPMGVTVVGEAEDAMQALQAIDRLRPDLLLLDIQMPLLNGLQLSTTVQQLEHRPLLIFVTGYSEYAAEAFDREAIDYLMKPVSAERLARCLVRARRRIAAARPAPEAVATTPMEEAPLKRLPVRTDYAVRLLRVEDVLYAEAKQKSVYVYTTADESNGLRSYYTLTQLEGLLPSETFFRIHDSYLVNLDAVEELSFLGNHAYAIRLVGGQTLPVGRTRYAALRERLGLQRIG